MTLCYNRAHVGWRRMPFKRFDVVCVWPLSASCCAQLKRDAFVFLTVRGTASVRRHRVGFDVLECPYSPRRVARGSLAFGTRPSSCDRDLPGLVSLDTPTIIIFLVGVRKREDGLKNIKIKSL